jgi:hypothetical protein
LGVGTPDLFEELDGISHTAGRPSTRRQLGRQRNVAGVKRSHGGFDRPQPANPGGGECGGCGSHLVPINDDRISTAAHTVRQRESGLFDHRDDRCALSVDHERAELDGILLCPSVCADATPDAIAGLEYHHVATCIAQAPGASEPRRARTDDDDLGHPCRQFMFGSAGKFATSASLPP